MPARTPRMDGHTPPEGAAFVADVLASNLRVYRHLRVLDQATVAQRMTHLGHRWVRATVSEVERGRRNVSVPELLSLSLVLGASVATLLDPRGPQVRGEGAPSGPALAVANPDPDQEIRSDLVIDGDEVSGLICGHDYHPAVKWDGPRLAGVRFRPASSSRRDGKQADAREAT